VAASKPEPTGAGILSAIGNTPLVELKKIYSFSHFRLFAKMEGLNPGGSAKDRPAISILEHGLETGAVQPGGVVIESSSGNMGIGLAQACAYYGLHLICVVDSKTTSGNLQLLRAYGAEVEIVTKADPDTGEFLQARLARVQELLVAIKGSFWPNQYANEYNPIAHRQTVREIVTALDGRLDFLFVAVSTCGTIRGCSDYIKQMGLSTKVYAVDAVGSVIFGGEKRKRLIPGHGAAVRPKLYRPGLADECILVTDVDCVVGCRRLVRQEGILAGGSSGAVVMAVEQASPVIKKDAVCAMIFPDKGERYLDTIYSDRWVFDHFGDISHLWQQQSKAESCVMRTS
jgi:N-(2-amino-2-carboxyethyl)-L-glutamate synthase